MDVEDTDPFTAFEAEQLAFFEEFKDLVYSHDYWKFIQLIKLRANRESIHAAVLAWRKAAPASPSL